MLASQSVWLSIRCDVVCCACRSLALVCLMRAECWQASGLVEYNFSCFKSAITQLLEVKARTKAAADAKPTPSKLHSSASAIAAPTPGGAGGSIYTAGK